MAERLKVCLIEEKLRASPMRNDVIHVSGLDELPLPQAFLTVWMLQDEAASQCLPSPTIATLRRGPAHLATSFLSSGFRLGLKFGVALCPGLGVELAISIPARYGPVTAGVGTESK